MTMIQARSLGMTFAGNQVALRDVDLTIGAGEFVSIVGPSGCGKSTLLRLIAGLEQASQGELTVADLSPQQARRTTQRVGYVFQDPTLLPWRTALENVRLPLELHGTTGEDPSAAARRSLELVGLNHDDAKKYPRTLSGGMRMRVSLARAIVAQPSVLLADEPFAALDDMLRQQLNEELLRIWGERRAAVLFVTHNVSEAVFLSQRVLVMSRQPGTIVQQIEVPLDYPRLPSLRDEARFAELTGRVSSRLRETAA